MTAATESDRLMRALRDGYRPGGVSLSDAEIARRAGLSPDRVGPAMAALRKRGLLETCIDERQWPSRRLVLLPGEGDTIAGLLAAEAAADRPSRAVSPRADRVPPPRREERPRVTDAERAAVEAFLQTRGASRFEEGSLQGMVTGALASIGASLQVLHRQSGSRRYLVAGRRYDAEGLIRLVNGVRGRRGLAAIPAPKGKGVLDLFSEAQS